MNSTTEKTKNRDWIITEDNYQPQKEGLFASLFTQGNGHIGMRGSYEELGSVNIQGLYAAGLYKKIKTTEFYPADNFFKKKFVFDEDVAKTERNDQVLVNLPDPLLLAYKVDDSAVNMWDDRVKEYRRSLNLKNGELQRSFNFNPQRNGTLRFLYKRFCTMNSNSYIVQESSVKSEGFRGALNIQCGIDARSYTYGKNEINEISHLFDKDSITLQGKIANSVPSPFYKPESNHKCSSFLIKTKISVKVNDKIVDPAKHFSEKKIYSQIFSLNIAPGDTVTVNKISCIDIKFHQKQVPTSETVKIDQTFKKDYSELLEEQNRYWKKLWERTGFSLKGQEEIEKKIRLAYYHLIITRPKDETVSISAKGLSGPGYKGIFWWDTEIYIAPFFYSLFPEEGVKLLKYRSLTLHAAKTNAEKNGFSGAKYPWNTTVSGEETCPPWLPIGKNQIHICADIVYSIYNYVKITGDHDFLYQDGAPIIIETARYYISRITQKNVNGKTFYTFTDIGGPDEYHTCTEDNAYTNFMVKKHLAVIKPLIEKIKSDHPENYKALKTKTKLTEKEIAHFTEVGELIYIPHKTESGIIEQFSGYLNLKDNWETVGDSYGGPAADYHLSKGLKQPDVLLLFALFPEDFSLREKLVNWDIYEKHTQHGSSLSVGIHSALAARMGLTEKALDYLEKSVNWDIKNINSDTHLGIHTALYGSIFMAIVFGFGGITQKDDIITIEPKLPYKWTELNFNHRHNGTLLSFHITKNTMTVTHNGNTEYSQKFSTNGKEYTVKPGESVSVKYVLSL